SRKRNGVSKSSSRRRKRERVPARSRRFSPEEHARALSLMVAGMKREQVAKTIGCTTESLRRWYAEGKKQGLVTKVSKRDDTSVATRPAAAEPAATSAPHDPGAGLGYDTCLAWVDRFDEALGDPKEARGVRGCADTIVSRVRGKQGDAIGTTRRGR